MRASARTTPVELRAPHGARSLEIDFADGHTAVYPHDILRGYCPCAICQGHQGPVRYVPGGNLELTDIAEVGDYALRLTWADGHATGLYTFNFLRELCSCLTCLPEREKQQAFRRAPSESGESGE
jgi:DUF971 family protein